MDSALAPIAVIAPGRLIGMAPDGVLRLVWGDATIRIPVFDLPHLAATLDAWMAEEEPPALRRGYYYLCAAPGGGVQLWMNTAGLLLSRDDLRQLAGLVEAVERELCAPLCRQPRNPLGLGYRRLSVLPPDGQRQN